MDFFESMYLNNDAEDVVYESDVTDTLCIAAIRGWHYNIIYSISGSDDHVDGHLAKTIDLMQGERYTDLGLSPKDWGDIDEGLSAIGIQEAFCSRRDPSRKIILQSRSTHVMGNIKNGAAADQSMVEDLRIVKDLTEQLNELLFLTMKEWHEYNIAPPIRKTNEDGELVSLDYYLLDPDVIYVMENSGFILDPDFAHSEDAAMFFSPGRKSYPKGVRKYGFVDSE